MPRPMITQHVPPRSLAMLLAVAFALTGLAGHLYVLKKPMGYLAEARDTFFDLRRAHPSDQPIEARIRSVEASTAALREKPRARARRSRQTKWWPSLSVASIGSHRAAGCN